MTGGLGESVTGDKNVPAAGRERHPRWEERGSSMPGALVVQRLWVIDSTACTTLGSARWAWGSLVSTFEADGGSGVWKRKGARRLSAGRPEVYCEMGSSRCGVEAAACWVGWSSGWFLASVPPFYLYPATDDSISIRLSCFVWDGLTGISDYAQTRVPETHPHRILRPGMQWRVATPVAFLARPRASGAPWGIWGVTRRVAHRSRVAQREREISKRGEAKVLRSGRKM